MKFQLRDYQQNAVDEGLKFFQEPARENALIVLPTGCHEKGYEILMYDGTKKKVEDISVGDLIMGDDCTKRTVIRLHRGTDRMYRITPNAGSPFVVNGGHILHLYRTPERRHTGYAPVLYTTISVNEYLGSNLTFRRTHKLHRCSMQSKRKKSLSVTGFSVEPIGFGDFYGFECDGNHLYLDHQLFVHHNSGKSLVIAELANRLGENLLVFQPSKEILEQNLAKMKTYTDDCSAYSASVGEKKVSKITFATIGSVRDHIDEFKHFHYVCVDEAHGVSGESGMYLNFLSMLECKVLGLTATPFRLYSDTYWDKGAKAMRTTNARLIMLHNDPNRFFSRILYVAQIQTLLERGYLARLRYFSVKPEGWRDNKIFVNSSGSDFSSKSVQWMMDSTDHLKHTISVVRRLLRPKDGRPRTGIMVFMQFVEDAEELCANVADSAFVCGTTTKKNRERIVEDFKSGKIKVLANCTALATGFDHPALDTVVMARPTMSLALYYQIVGRCLRPFPGKEGWVIDTVGNLGRFGEVGNLYLGHSQETHSDEMFGWVYNWSTRQHEWKQLTGVILSQDKP